MTIITAFVQDKTALEKGLFDCTEAGGKTLPEELIPVRMGKIVKDRYPELHEEVFPVSAYVTETFKNVCRTGGEGHPQSNPQAV